MVPEQSRAQEAAHKAFGSQVACKNDESHIDGDNGNGAGSQAIWECAGTVKPRGMPLAPGNPSDRGL